MHFSAAHQYSHSKCMKQWNTSRNSLNAMHTQKRLHANVLTQIHGYTSMYTMYIRYATLRHQCTNVDTVLFMRISGISAFFIQLTHCHLHIPIELELADEPIQSLVLLFISHVTPSLSSQYFVTRVTVVKRHEQCFSHSD